MASFMGSFLRKAYSKRHNVISASTHERWQSLLGGVNADFHLFQHEGMKTWNTKYNPLPNNHKIYNSLNLPINQDYTVVLSQNKYAHFQLMQQYAQRLQIPLISYEHCLPAPNLPRGNILELKKMSGEFNVFISEFSRKAWLYGEDEAEVIHHGLDTDLFCLGQKERKGQLLSVVNDWRNRDWCCGFRLWEEATKGLNVKVWGDTPGLSVSADGVEHLISEYQESRVFVNTSLISPVPMALLEAASCGCAIVTSETCMIPEIFTHGKDCFMSNDPKKLRNYCQKLLQDEQLATEMGLAARKTIVDNYNLPKFVAKFNDLLDRASNCILGA